MHVVYFVQSQRHTYNVGIDIMAIVYLGRVLELKKYSRRRNRWYRYGRTTADKVIHLDTTMSLVDTKQRTTPHAQI